MGSTVRTIRVSASVPDHHDQEDEIERRELWKTLQAEVKAVVDDPKYDDILATFNGDAP